MRVQFIFRPFSLKLFQLQDGAVRYGLVEVQGFGSCLIFETDRNNIGLSSKPKMPVVFKSDSSWLNAI